MTVLLSLRKMWNVLKRGEFSPGKWLEADLATLCTVRWCGAYLCTVGRDWSPSFLDRMRQKLFFSEEMNYAREARKRLELFFSKEMNNARRVLQSVTWNKSEENENAQVISVKWLVNEFNGVDLSAETTTAYGNRITWYDLCGTETVDSYSFEVDSLASSYPALGSDRVRVTASLLHSVILAKHFGVEKLRRIRRYYEQYQMRKWGILRKALKLYLKQTVTNISNEPEIVNMLCGGYSWCIPLFPDRLQLVAMWDQGTNWRVLQASAHADVSSCLLDMETGLTPLHQLGRKPCNVFDYHSNIARNELERETRPGCAE